MTQSLIRTAPDAAHWLHVNGRPLSGTHAQIVSILRSRLGHNHGALLAQPNVAADGSVAWTTPLAGQALRAADLPADERDALAKRAERMLGDVRNLAAQMRAEGTTGAVVAAILEQALQFPAGDWLYSVDGKPVYVMWGHGSGAAPDPATAGLAAAAAVPADAPAAAAAAAAGSALPASAPLQASVAPGPGPGPVPSPAAAPAVAAATVAATAATGPTGAGTPAMARRPWLLAAAALLLLAALLFGWSRCSSPGAADLSATIAQAEERNRALEDELARRRAAQMQCVPDPAEPPPPVLPERPVALAPPEPPASEPPAVVPEDPPSRPVARAPPRPEPTPPPPAKPVMPQMPDLTPAPAPASTPRATPPAPTRQACKPMRPGDEPEVIMIVDASGSMREGLGNMSRLEAAKRAADSMIRGLPAPVDVGLVDFTACNQVRRDKFYSAPERGALIGEINALSPKAGTPLAQAIERAGRVASDSAEAVLVVVSDGGDSCGGDPCGAARRLKAQRPNVVINVIDLSTSSSDRAVLQCVASAGGGRVLRPGDPLDMQQKMKEAAGSAACTP